LPSLPRETGRTKQDSTGMGAWEPGDMRIDGNKTVDQLARQVIRGWMRRKHEDCFFNDPLLKGLGNYPNSAETS